MENLKQQHPRILVTGGAGFIGCNLVRDLLLQDGLSVLTLDKLTYAGHRQSLADVLDAPQHRFVHGDICDGKLVPRLLREFQPTAILHLAAETHVDRSIDGPADFVRTNVEGTLGLLEAALGYWRSLEQSHQRGFRFVHVSTDEVYGSLSDGGAFCETTPYAPNSPYSASKAAADHFVRAYHRTYGLPTLITHCSNNYGPYQLPEKLIPLMILKAVEGQPLPVYGDGQHIRDWLYVADHTRGLRMILAGGQPGEVYLLGGGAERTNLQVVTSVCRIIDQCCPDLKVRPCEQLLTHVTDRPGHDRHYAVDFSRTQRQLGWQPQYDFETGLQRTVEWYLQHATWIEQVAGGGGLRRRVGLSRNGEP